MTGTGDVAVVGAGLIGLAIAFDLAQAGANVRMYDRAEPGRAASWAGAGMLAPYTENAEDPALRDLCVSSLAAYPDFIDRIRATGGIDPHLRLDGIVHAAYSHSDTSRLQQQASALAQRGIACRLLDRRDALWEEPWLGAGVRGGLIVSGEGYVDNRRLTRAMTAACEALGVRVTRVSRLTIETDRRRVLGVNTDVGFAPAGTVVNACGAWAGDLAGVPSDCATPIIPVKGQMLALSAPAGLVRHPTWLPGAYVVPRGDGRLLIGATVEPNVDDMRVTAAGMSALLTAALCAAPSLGGFAMSETWAGVRPGTPDGRPFIGRTPLEGLLVAAGHFRNGILLAPITAQAILACVGGQQLDWLAPFSLPRDAATAA